uniref:Uncharacterized protein n=1 Tax=Vespula pensylvanica TaxID=30213 RepID=A0A834KTK6_VESPE|nr:hypothetical protein H0235_012642 [Vespula pensylvanica]
MGGYDGKEKFRHDVDSRDKGTMEKKNQKQPARIIFQDDEDGRFGRGGCFFGSLERIRRTYIRGLLSGYDSHANPVSDSTSPLLVPTYGRDGEYVGAADEA